MSCTCRGVQGWYAVTAVHGVGAADLRVRRRPLDEIHGPPHFTGFDRPRAASHLPVKEHAWVAANSRSDYRFHKLRFAVPFAAVDARCFECGRYPHPTVFLADVTHLRRNAFAAMNRTLCLHDGIVRPNVSLEQRDCQALAVTSAPCDR